MSEEYVIDIEPFHGPAIHKYMLFNTSELHQTSLWVLEKSCLLRMKQSESCEVETKERRKPVTVLRANYISQVLPR